MSKGQSLGLLEDIEMEKMWVDMRRRRLGLILKEWLDMEISPSIINNRPQWFERQILREDPRPRSMRSPRRPSGNQVYTGNICKPHSPEYTIYTVHHLSWTPHSLYVPHHLRSIYDVPLYEREHHSKRKNTRSFHRNNSYQALIPFLQIPKTPHGCMEQVEKEGR